MKIINKTNNGQLSLCKCCNIYQLEFGNMLLSFHKKDFLLFKRYVMEINGNMLETSNSHMPLKRKILLSFPIENCFFCLNAYELEELKGLLTIDKEIEKNCRKSLTRIPVSLN